MAETTRPQTVGPRQPCPCGSGRRFKACHGAESGGMPFVVRTFGGLPGECDWVAMREIVPAATASVQLIGDNKTAERPVQVCSLLPAALPALVRQDGAIWLGLHVQHNYGDPSRDLAAALELALIAEPGTQVMMVTDPGPGARLQDLVDPATSFEVTVHAGYEYWVADMDDPTGQVAASLEAANAAVSPTSRLPSVDAAYWTQVGGKEFLRWVMPHDEDQLLNALARLHTRGLDKLVDDDRLVGSFRAHGLLAPVWELPPGTGATALEEPAQRFEQQLGEALTQAEPLSAEERSARSGLANRQLTIR